MHAQILALRLVFDTTAARRFESDGALAQLTTSVGKVHTGTTATLS
jgi:hypothetical protein